MREETNSILCQRTQNGWSKRSIYTLKLLLNGMKHYKMPCNSGIRSRRKLAFEDSSERSKRRKSKELQQTVRFPELTHATKMSLRSAGKTDATKLFSEA
jgi:hypothetical protein